MPPKKTRRDVSPEKGAKRLRTSGSTSSSASSGKPRARASSSRAPVAKTPKGTSNSKNVEFKFKRTPKAKQVNAAKNYVLPPKLSDGTIVQDALGRKQQWRVGKPIGQGGFGRIYLASSDVARPVDAKTAKCVLKMEPHDNGPLFCEQSVYQRFMKKEQLDEWCRQQRLDYVGVPQFFSFGSHSVGKEKFRFLVIQRMEKDLDKVIKANGNKLPRLMCAQLTVRMIDALHYLHSHNYAHADIKESNMMLSSDNKVFLVDYGLACKFTLNEAPRKYDADPRRRHDGTREYTSRDAHDGALPSRRGDLEILAYCLVRWLSGSLPWWNEQDIEEVARLKHKHMKNVTEFVRAVKLTSYPEVKQLLDYVVGLDYQERPDYSRLRKMFLNVIKQCGGALESPFCLSEGSQCSTARAKVVKSPMRQALPRTVLKTAPSAQSGQWTAGRAPLKQKNPEAESSAGRLRRRPQKVSPPSKHPRNAKARVQYVEEESDDSDTMDEGSDNDTSGSELYTTCLDQTVMLQSLDDSTSELDLDSSMTGWTDAMKAQMSRTRDRQTSTSKGSSRGTKR